MKCTVTKGYDGAYIVTGENGRTGTFHPFKRTITGARDKHKGIKSMTASNLQDHLRIRGALRNPCMCVHLPDDRGIFDKVSGIDIYQNLRQAHSFIDVPIRVLEEVVILCEKKPL